MVLHSLCCFSWFFLIFLDYFCMLPFYMKFWHVMHVNFYTTKFTGTCSAAIVKSKNILAFKTYYPFLTFLSGFKKIICLNFLENLYDTCHYNVSVFIKCLPIKFICCDEEARLPLWNCEKLKMKVSFLLHKARLITVSYYCRTQPAWSQLSPWEFHYLCLFSLHKLTN